MYNRMIIDFLALLESTDSLRIEVGTFARGVGEAGRIKRTSYQEGADLSRTMCSLVFAGSPDSGTRPPSARGGGGARLPPLPEFPPKQTPCCPMVHVVYFTVAQLRSS